MSGRAVGGAAGAGCGVFGLVGILVSVGLVVWLGSQATSSLSGDDGSKAETTDVTDLSQPTAVVDLAPNGDLLDTNTLVVSATGIATGPVEITTCLTHEAWSANGLLGCDPATTATDLTVDDPAAATFPYVAHRTITVADVTYDCAAFPAACSVVVHPPGQPDQGVGAGIRFEAQPPVSEAERPPGG